MPPATTTAAPASPSPTGTTTPAATTDDGAAELAPLTERVVADRTDDGSFTRGKRYHRGGHIYDTFRRGATVNASCHGSSGGPYRVEATLAPVGKHARDPNPVAVECDCPRGGFCKHVVALLLTWIATPERFPVRPALADSLAGRSQEELIALIELMARRAPELEDLIDLPVPLAGGAAPSALNPDAIRRQVGTALQFDRNHRYDYDDYYHMGTNMASKLDHVLTIADAYAAAGDGGSALEVYAILLDELLPRYGEVRDDDGDLGGIIIACDVGLSALLGMAFTDDLDTEGEVETEVIPAAVLDRVQRQRLFRALFDIWWADIAAGGHDLCQLGPEAIERMATPEERAEVATWVRGVMRPASDGDTFVTAWANRAAIGFLSMLGSDAGFTDEDLLREFRNAELWEEAADTMVRLHQVEEALALAARRLTVARVLTRFADRLIAVDAEYTGRAIALVDGRLWETEGADAHEDAHYLSWLEGQYAAHGMADKALAAVRRRFKTAPTQHTYDAVKAAALLPGQPEGTWTKLRPDLLKTLRAKGEWAAVVEAHLGDGEVADALAGLERMSKAKRGASAGWGWGGDAWSGTADSLEARVAAAAAKAHPDAAVSIYEGIAERLIEARQRPYYQEAAKTLVKAKKVLDKAGRGEEWAPRIADLRQRHKTLRALREELDRAKVG